MRASLASVAWLLFCSAATATLSPSRHRHGHIVQQPSGDSGSEFAKRDLTGRDEYASGPGQHYGQQQPTAWEPEPQPGNYENGPLFETSSHARKAVATTGRPSTSTARRSTTSTKRSGTSSSKRSSSATQPTCSSSPAPSAGTLPNCKRCEGQPGTDQYCGLTIDTNYYEQWPKTCKVITFDLEITQTTSAPDGVPRIVQLINGQMPGPLLRASWGDTIVVKVTNNLPKDSKNGTAMHFHGVRFLNNNMHDGVPSITQCPIAPGSSMTYTWVAEEYGTSWYHAHISVQAWMGVSGPIIIDGPSTASYDEDLGTVMVTDWSHRTVDELFPIVQDARIDPATGRPRGGQPVLDNGLINAKNVWYQPDGKVVGSRAVFANIQKGRKYRLRTINTAIQSTFKFYIDNHKLQVIATDWVPIDPYVTDLITFSSGQRYDLIVTADATPAAYWMRADNQEACARILQGRDIKAVFAYKGFTDSTPTSKGYTYTDECVDEPASKLVPHLKRNAGSADVTSGPIDSLIRPNEAQLFRWYLSGTTFQAEWSDPALLHVWDNTTIPNKSGKLLVELPQRNKMVYVIAQSSMPLPHPMHLHGHDSFVLAQGTGQYSSSTPLTLINPPRRDTVTLPGNGYLVIGFKTDNPGLWLMHCHLGFHVSMGYALLFDEMQDQIVPGGGVSDSCTLVNTCKRWRDYAAERGIVTPDSGV